ncbi:TPA: hypothetical protein RVS02_003362 [Aeromonas veronii]|uniref:hypothetical protein n=1 Tax=Aeromonas TaxID=642 RepID=UPI001C5BB5C1|nr:MULTISPECIES: hypothetical protein [Aeromonas]MBW3833318.1 ATPase [Aeromonas hydrophila]MBW5263923.1 ATPase [Aeromonas hydrophila]MBW5278896.1 ATPase [Aeromonas hydrophila]UJP34295.1 hypothetical protein K3G24_19750 [Aeromonas veronii]HEA3201808.1 hypothetical protein [Aeromonas veronii]
MLKRILKLLKAQPSLKASDIARHLDVPRKKVNQALYDNTDVLVKDDDTFCWSLRGHSSCELELVSGRTWITQEHFEQALLRQGSPLDSSHNEVTIKIRDGQHLLLCAVARVLTLSNQLVKKGKKVTLDFTNNESTVSYLGRACFFSRLDPTVNVLPKRPPDSASEQYIANNISLVELLEICPEDNVPDRIKQSFVGTFGTKYSTKLFTLVAEMVSNVEDHSETQIPGFAALQSYGPKEKKSVVVVISDCGKGICATLRPGLDKHFPDVAKMFPLSEPDANPRLILHAMKHRGLSRLGEGRGAGFHTSHGGAAILNAKVTIRQDNFVVRLQYEDGHLKDGNCNWDTDLPTLMGTHIVFEFFLTAI